VGWWFGLGWTKKATVRHFTITSILGCDDSVKKLRQLYTDRFVSKEELAVAATFRVHQTAVDATKSSQRQRLQKQLIGQSIQLTSIR
jgi:hypothetical protein